MTILVAGATGTVGRALVGQLRDAGHAVRALTRDPARAALPAGVEVVRGDLTDAGTLTAAFGGVEAAHLITFTGAFGDWLTNGPEIVDALVAAGVARVSVLGGWDTGTLEPALDAAGVAWALLSPTEFMANTLVDHAEAIRTTGEVRVLDLGRTSAAVHEADIAAVALAVLTGAAPTGREYLLTGGEAVTLEQKLAAVSDATGQPVTLTRLSEEQARADLAAAGTSAEMIEFTIALESDPPPVGALPVGTVAEVTGRPPRTFAAWAQENADAFRAVPG
ncbi:NmrA family NAD(P)-binding protein [Actinomycetospora rhizophila]|uniref:NmrA family NAD(P)-binding protein n=1 Tax=Actinomycetospora rhizophila TaxID=1416876 RepID=A0ABV9Z8C4_9PSEU